MCACVLACVLACTREREVERESDGGEAGERGWRRRADTAKMQTNELKNAGCIAVVGVGRAALPAI